VPSSCLGPEAAVDSRRKVVSSPFNTSGWSTLPLEVLKEISRSNGGSSSAFSNQLSFLWCIVPESAIIQFASVGCIDPKVVTPLTEMQARVVLGDDMYRSLGSTIGSSNAVRPGSLQPMAELEGRRWEQVPELATHATESNPGSKVGQGIWLPRGMVGARIVDVLGVPCFDGSGFLGNSIPRPALPFAMMRDLLSEGAEPNPASASHSSAPAVPFDLQRAAAKVWHATQIPAVVAPSLNADLIETDRKSQLQFILSRGASHGSSDTDFLQAIQATISTLMQGQSQFGTRQSAASGSASGGN